MGRRRALVPSSEFLRAAIAGKRACAGRAHEGVKRHMAAGPASAACVTPRLLACYAVAHRAIAARWCCLQVRLLSPVRRSASDGMAHLRMVCGGTPLQVIVVSALCVRLGVLARSPCRFSSRCCSALLFSSAAALLSSCMVGAQA